MRSMSSGEEGRRGQQAYASFLESSGGSLNLVRGCVKVSHNPGCTLHPWNSLVHQPLFSTCHHLTAPHSLHRTAQYGSRGCNREALPGMSPGQRCRKCFILEACRRSRMLSRGGILPRRSKQPAWRRSRTWQAVCLCRPSSHPRGHRQGHAASPSRLRAMTPRCTPVGPVMQQAAAAAEPSVSQSSERSFAK